VNKEKIKVHILVERELYEGLWDITRKRFKIPWKRLHVIINEAFREYIERHKEGD